MFKCKDCGQPMESGSTKLRPIEYDEKGNLINRHKAKKPKKKRKKVEK